MQVKAVQPIPIDAQRLDLQVAVGGADHSQRPSESNLVGVVQEVGPIEVQRPVTHACQSPAAIDVGNIQLGAFHKQPAQDQAAAQQRFRPVEFDEHLFGPAARRLDPVQAQQRVEAVPAAPQPDQGGLFAKVGVDGPAKIVQQPHAQPSGALHECGQQQNQRQIAGDGMGQEAAAVGEDVQALLPRGALHPN